MPRKSITYLEWLDKAHFYHGHKYTYAKVIWKGQNEKVIITCPIHGDFELLAWSHVNSKKPCGCKLCANEQNKIRQRKYNNKIINDILHENNVNCSIVETELFERIDKSLLFYCKKHDYSFSRTLSSILTHKHSLYCPKCLREYQSTKNTLTPDELKYNLKILDLKGSIEFPELETYDKGSKAIYSFICKKHGLYRTRYNRVYESLKLGNNGCPKCAYEKCATCNLNEPNIVLLNMNKIHNNRYEYDMSTYTSVSNKMTIICPRHGKFLQDPSSHLRGCGCPKCKASKMELLLINTFDNLNIQYEYQYQNSWLGKLTLDFFLPEYNLAIECQGKQHFEPIEWFGGISQFNTLRKRDIIKKTLCEEHHTKLLYYCNLPDYKIFLDEPVYNNINDLVKEII